METAMARARKPRKRIVKYNVFCDGYSEAGYFKRLMGIINSDPTSRKRIQLNVKVQNSGSPKKTAIKANSGAWLENAAAVFDYDNRDDDFRQALDICIANGIDHGYSNMCFELWLILHKMERARRVSKAQNYWELLKAAYGLEFESFSECKQRGNCQRIMAQISLEDVLAAVQRGKDICRQNESTHEAYTTGRGGKYYDNPDLSIHLFVEKLLREVGLLAR